MEMIDLSSDIIFVCSCIIILAPLYTHTRTRWASCTKYNNIYAQTVVSEYIHVLGQDKVIALLARPLLQPGMYSTPLPTARRNIKVCLETHRRVEEE
jgi:hypothetical protein